jgi:hypothetical protein
MKNPKFFSSWANAPFDGPERNPRGIKFRLKIEFLDPLWLTHQSGLKYHVQAALLMALFHIVTE